MKLTKKTLEVIPVEALEDTDELRALTNQEEIIHGQKVFSELAFGRDPDKADDSLITYADVLDMKDEMPVGWTEKVTITSDMLAERTFPLPRPVAAKNSMRIATEGSGWLALNKDFDVIDSTAVKWGEHIDFMAGDVVTVEYKVKHGDIV